MAAISKITIDGFKAFPDNFTLELEGKNLLMYGENGSGKSSIYYALHSLLQSQCKDKNPIYFDINHPESILNQNKKKFNAKVEIEFAGSDVTYGVSIQGYKESVTQPISPLRDLNGQCVFINHKFLFNVFSFRNSQYIDLFPVFIKDILPFVLTQDKSEYISMIYDDVMKGIKRRGKSNTIDPSYQARIDKFNAETKYVIEQINSNAVETATIIYNNHFRNSEDCQIKITLGYDNNRDKVPQPNKSYWLRCGLRYQNVEKAGVMEPKSVSTSMELLQPSITLKIEELQNDGVSYRAIEKPQTYFNEAKLTAIALSIRFALLDTVTAANGRFLALDDMLISLDMSNRMKVVDYLLNVVVKKYKVYLFTHDKLFYATLKKKIAIEKMQREWLMGGLYMHDVDEDNDYKPCLPYPKFIEDKDMPLEMMDYYAKHDYPACGQKLRKWCEEILEKLYPDTLKKRVDLTSGNTIETSLNDRIISLESYCAKESIDFSHFKNLKIYKDNVLNTVSHYDIGSPIYKEEILNIVKVLNELKKILEDRVEIKVNHAMGIELVKPDGTPVTICIDIKKGKMLLLNVAGHYRISYFIKCYVKELIINGVRHTLPSEEIYESIYDAYNKYCVEYGLPNTDNLLDIIYDHSVKLRDKI
ncbi:ATP-binding protein [Prevotella sp. E9-3]|uniref:AAA family ATPase n=1 Tax=Prevotella sp. E9-3 TaxID=2913621 RepID=UPI001EDB019A|nr:AAA family ATPase [Prevotella sp. E9-3]UKK47032.1 ATP-binding protein [Prevotella sp. E9-3]